MGFHGPVDTALRSIGFSDTRERALGQGGEGRGLGRGRRGGRSFGGRRRLGREQAVGKGAVEFRALKAPEPAGTEGVGRIVPQIVDETGDEAAAGGGGSRGGFRGTEEALFRRIGRGVGAQGRHGFDRGAQALQLPVDVVLVRVFGFRPACRRLVQAEHLIAGCDLGFGRRRGRRQHHRAVRPLAVDPREPGVDGRLLLLGDKLPMGVQVRCTRLAIRPRHHRQREPFCGPAGGCRRSWAKLAFQQSEQLRIGKIITQGLLFQSFECFQIGEQVLFAAGGQVRREFAAPAGIRQHTFQLGVRGLGREKIRPRARAQDPGGIGGVGPAVDVRGDDPAEFLLEGGGLGERLQRRGHVGVARKILGHRGHGLVEHLIQLLQAFG